MTSRNIKVVPKFIRANLVDFHVVYPNGDSGIIARVEYPLDNQINDNVDTNRLVADALSKRIKKSVL